MMLNINNGCQPFSRHLLAQTPFSGHRLVQHRHVECPERSEPLGFGLLRVFLIFSRIYARLVASIMKTVIGHGNEKSSKSEREMKKLYDLNPFVRFVWRVNTHVHCNNRVLPAEVSGICYEHEDDQRCRNPYKHPVPF